MILPVHLLKKYGIETDLHATKDNQIVCFHDFTLKRKFKLSKSIKNTNYSNLKKISKDKKAEIPLLKDLLKKSLINSVTEIFLLVISFLKELKFIS